MPLSACLRAAATFGAWTGLVWAAVLGWAFWTLGGGDAGLYAAAAAVAWDQAAGAALAYALLCRRRPASGRMAGCLAFAAAALAVAAPSLVLASSALPDAAPTVVPFLFGQALFVDAAAACVWSLALDARARRLPGARAATAAFALLLLGLAPAPLFGLLG